LQRQGIERNLKKKFLGTFIFLHPFAQNGEGNDRGHKNLPTFEGGKNHIMIVFFLFKQLAKKQCFLKN